MCYFYGYCDAEQLRFELTDKVNEANAMARKKLFDFKKDGKKVEVFTGDRTLDVYFKVNDGSSKSSGLRYNPDTGNFKSSSGSIVKFDDAQTWIMKKI